MKIITKIHLWKMATIYGMNKNLHDGELGCFGKRALLSHRKARPHRDPIRSEAHSR
jgi:hypothetical protein